MDYTTLKNRVFSNHFFNSFLPSTLGAFESSAIFNFLLAYESIQENLTTEMNVSEIWTNDVPTWYTSSLPDLFFVPKFIGETDQEYIDRLFLLIGVSQNESTIINSVFSVIEKGINSITDIQIIDKLEGVSALWDNIFDLDTPAEDVEDWDGTKVWSSEENVARTLFAVHMQFFSRGSNTDITTWDYWILPANYTKIEDMVKLYKPPGSTFELRLNIPVDYEQSFTLFSNTLVKLVTDLTKTSDTTIV